MWTGASGLRGLIWCSHFLCLSCRLLQSLDNVFHRPRLHLMEGELAKANVIVEDKIVGASVTVLIAHAGNHLEMEETLLAASRL